MDTPGADAKRRCGWSFHAGLITSILSQLKSAARRLYRRTRTREEKRRASAPVAAGVMGTSGPLAS